MIIKNKKTKITKHKKSATNFSSTMCAPLVTGARYMKKESLLVMTFAKNQVTEKAFQQVLWFTKLIRDWISSSKK